jgi:hypothetical protein
MIIRLAAIALMGLISFAAFASDDATDVSATMMNDNMFMAANPKDRRDGRQDKRDGKQDCRQEEGRVGDDKRDCKQDNRGGGDDAEESEPKTDA